MKLHVRSRMSCTLATCADCLALALALQASRGSLLLAFSLHLLATFFSGWLPDLKERRARSQTKRGLARVLTFCIPVVGAALSWSIRNHHAGTRKQEQERLAAFHKEYLDAPGDLPVPDPFTGAFDVDVARIADAESFSAILEFGTTDHKRNALARLAALGEPKHMRLLRACLLSPDTEVRLFAHAQLDGMDHHLAGKLEAARADFEAQPSRADLRLAYGEAHAAMASSGVFDDETSAWHRREAESLTEGLSAEVREAFAAAQAEERDASEAEAAEEASKRKKKGRERRGLWPRRRVQEAVADTEPPCPIESPEELGSVLLAQAHEAYAERDFRRLLFIAAAMQDEQQEIPIWLETCLEGRLPS